MQPQSTELPYTAEERADAVRPRLAHRVAVYPEEVFADAGIEPQEAVRAARGHELVVTRVDEIDGHIHSYTLEVLNVSGLLEISNVLPYEIYRPYITEAKIAATVNLKRQAASGAPTRRTQRQRERRSQNVAEVQRFVRNLRVS